MSSRTPRPPKSLKAAGRALWVDVVGEFEFSRWELHILESACTHRDLWARAAAGRSTRDRAEARAEAVVVSRLLRELRLSVAPDDRPPSLAGGRRA